MDILWPRPGKYVAAVSGGVDSVSLLDMLARRGGYELIVAHVDHGWRNDSPKDAKLVKALAAKNNALFETTKLNNVKNEDTARAKRYEFFLKLQEKHKAEGVITAHHHNDYIETSIYNLLRGSGARGIVSPLSRQGILRPLINIQKDEIVRYAKSHNLEWREDTTNTDVSYRRNFIRRILLPEIKVADPHFETSYRQFIKDLTALHAQIEDYTKGISQGYKYGSGFVELPLAIVKRQPLPVLEQVIYEAVKGISANSPDSGAIYEAAWLLKSGRMPVNYKLTSRLKLSLQGDTVRITFTGVKTTSES